MLDRYGRNAFGWSLLMARRLVEAGVNLVQVNLGNNETWDTHGNAFPHLKDKLLPPTDQAVSALLDDLNESGLLESTLIVMAGEFGRTPRISTLPQAYKLPGPRPLGPGADRCSSRAAAWPAAGSIGSSDKIGGYPALRPADAREPRRHDLSRPRAAGDRRLARRSGPAPLCVSRCSDTRTVLSECEAIDSG